MANGVYWIGADGNVWVKGDQGTNSAGVADSNTNSYWTSRGFDRIDDPNPPINGGTTSGGSVLGTSTAPSGGGGGSGVAPKVLNQAGIDNTQQTIDQFPALLRDALAAEGVSYGNTVEGYNTQQEGQQKTYDKSTETNQLNYDSNFMDSIRAGIKGLGGLMSLLRGTGAGGGTAEDIARDTVGGVTASDIRGGADVQKENQTELDSILSAFLSELRLKRQQAKDTRVNNERAIRRDSNTQLQDLFGKMAGFYGDVGDEANSNTWMDRAGDLTPKIFADSRTKVSDYDTTPVTVKAPEVTAFAGPTQPNILAPPSDGQVGSGIFTMSDPRRRRELAPAGV